MIKSFRHAGLEAFFHTGSKAGIQPKHAERLAFQLGTLNRASGPNDMRAPPWRLHPLKGADAGRWAVRVDENWRLTFAFEGTDVVLLDYLDYH
ncbi:MAG: type II toxin-antitoxin system RelE/ParE family toxin [Steroidobacteraceae bacterium]